MRFTASASCYIRAPKQVVYPVLTGYRKYQTWIPDVVRSRLLAREGEVAIAEFISPPYGHEKLLLEFVESPPTSIQFTQVDRFRKGGFFGRLDLEPAAEGEGAMVHGQLGFQGSWRRMGCRRQLRQVLERTLEALADRSLKLLTSGFIGIHDQRAKLLEVEIGSSAVTMRIGKETYELVRRPGESDA